MEFADMSSMGAIVSPSFSIGLAMVQQAAQNATFHYTNVEVRFSLSLCVCVCVCACRHYAAVTSHTAHDGVEDGYAGT
jgi:hypothetical protein